jgi:hypothetical protein
LLVDSNFVQPGQGVSFGLPEDVKTIYDVVVNRNNDLADGLLTPAEIEQHRGPQPVPVRYGLLCGPPEGHANLDIVTPELHIEMVEQARRAVTNTGIVVVDTQITERDYTKPMVSRFLMPLLQQRGTWHVTLSDESAEGLSFLMGLLGHCRNVGVPAERTLVMVNKVPPEATFNESAYERAINTGRTPDRRPIAANGEPLGTYVGSIGQDNAIHRSINARQPTADIPTFTPLLDAVLSQVTGREDWFHSHLAHQPQHSGPPQGWNPTMAQTPQKKWWQRRDRN